jgi:putative PEP-CTERM system TPR-repeat lipoprotein
MYRSKNLPGVPPHRTGLVLWALAAALATASPVWAQQNNARSSQYFEDALKRYESKDYSGAVVQLKNVIKVDPRNLSAQVLLGKALLENEDFGPAEVALTEALRLGVNRIEVVVPLAKALIGQGRPNEVLSDKRFSPEGLPPSVQFQLLLQRAGAATELGDAKGALGTLDSARQLEPSNPAPWVLEVPARLRGQQLKEALEAANRAIAMAPNLADAHFAKGESLHVVPDLPGALAAYDRAISLNPDHLNARISRVGIYLDQNRTDDIVRELKTIAEKAPREPRGLYMRALMADRLGQPAESRKLYSQLVGMLDAIPAPYLRYRPQTQMLAGMSHHTLGQGDRAKPYLEGVLRYQPTHPVAKVLASIHLADRNYDRALESLEGYIRANPQDAQAKLLSASAHMAQGRHARATQIMQDALKAGDRPNMRTALGLSLVGSARYSDAIKELEAAYTKDPKQIPAGYALASLYAQTGQGAKALRVAEALNKEQPRQASLLFLLGTAKRAQGDNTGARTALEAALVADAGFAPAQLLLARLDIDTGGDSKALTRLNAVLAKEPKNLEALGMAAEIAERRNQLTEAQALLAKAEEHAGLNDATPSLATVNFHLRHGQVAQAKEAVGRAVTKAADAPSTLLGVARVNLAQGDVVTARSTLTRAAIAAQYSAPLLTQIALLQNQAGAPQAAAYSLDKALGDRPGYLPAQALRAEIDLRLGDLPKAEKLATQILSQNPKLGLGHGLLGDIAAARGEPEAAIAAYRKAHEIDRSTDSFMRLFAATIRRDRPGALRLADQWLASRPSDLVARRAVADVQLNAGNLPEARRAYEALLKLQPNDPEVLNNLANVMLRQNDAGALKTAERALQLSPGAAHIIGTVGWAAHKAGQSDRGLQMLRDARLRDPANVDTRFFLGSVLAGMGRNAEAREELRAAAASSYRDEAQRLLASLK